MEDLPGIFHTWKFEKDPTRNGEEIRGPILGFQIADNSYAILNEEDARRWQRENDVSDTCILSLYFKPMGEPMGPFTSAGP